MTVQAVQRHALSDRDRELARALLRAVESVGADDRVFVTIEPKNGERIHAEVPRSVLPGLEGLVESMALKGEATVVVVEQEVSPEEAAPLLGMSRPMVVQRIKQGDIPHRMVGTHHRIRLSDVLAFREADDLKRRALAEIGEHTDETTIRHGI